MPGPPASVGAFSPFCSVTRFRGGGVEGRGGGSQKGGVATPPPPRRRPPLLERRRPRPAEELSAPPGIAASKRSRVYSTLGSSGVAGGSETVSSGPCRFGGNVTHGRSTSSWSRSLPPVTAGSGLESTDIMLHSAYEETRDGRAGRRPFSSTTFEGCSTSQPRGSRRHGSATFSASAAHFAPRRHRRMAGADTQERSSGTPFGTAAVDGTTSAATVAGGSEPLGFVCAIIESRAREVGLASMHRRSMEFELTQFSDSNTYARACAALLALEPSSVVMSRTARGTQMHQVVEEALQTAGYQEPVVFVERRHFDETEGQTILDEANVVGLQSSEYAAKFVACAAFAALWCFVESSMETKLRGASAYVVYRGAADAMVIDAGTARLLELVADARDRRERGSVFGLFCCRTPGGSRLLRQSLLQPPAAVGEIRARQAAVGALLGDEDLFYELQRLLPGIGDLDLLAARLTAEPKTRGQQWCRAVVRTAVRLRHALLALPLLAKALDAVAAKGTSTLLVEARATLSQPKFADMLEELDRVLDGDGPPPHQSGQGSMAHAALLYSVRSGINALLDVARQTWNDALEQIHTLHRSYAIKYPDLGIKLEFTERRGWYLSHAKFPEGAAPTEFLRTAQKGNSGRQASTTRELNTENFKLRQAEREILAQTLSVLDVLFAELRSESALLYRASHAASLLDLMQAFVGYTLLLGESVCPELSNDPMAPMAIKAGRHPLMEQHAIRGPSDPEVNLGFEPLDYFIGETCHFQCVTGPNGGGKSTYLQTLAQLVVLAHIGCFIPAKYAKVRISSSLLTRIGSSDCVEANASTFLIEMQEAAHILRSVAETSGVQRCLVLIDELGRGTAHTDGLAICQAICERLLDMRVYTLFATHFYDICQLQSTFPGLRNMHVEVVEGEDRQSRVVVKHVASLEELLLKKDTRYGLHAAKQAGLPEKLLLCARDHAVRVDAWLRPQSRVNGSQHSRIDGSVPDIAIAGSEEKTGEDNETEKEADAAVRTAWQLIDALGSNDLDFQTLSSVLGELQLPWLQSHPGRDDGRERATNEGSQAGVDLDFARGP
eukprot:TRINITY_DN40896_c0_g1_i1.p1 TRINITY_DN40896_c0_g1~~TRINITY_DN40896_c0_g1_i1.p1  ORF type:complete len:1088 (-),score=162.31 TRINITY_DN40896_c0_g1_i1:310-3507(-)